MELKILSYNRHDVMEGAFVMPKKTVRLKEGEESFGERLARLRKAAGFSQRELAAEIGMSHRMIAYYETEAARLPIHLLPVLTKALGVSADELMGLEKVKKNGRTQDTRLWRRFSQVEKLPTAQRKQIVQILDAFLEREKLKKVG